jgi:hypothetical protein
VHRPVGLFTAHFEQESDIAAVQLAFAALRKEKNASVRETLNDKANDGNTASIEVLCLISLMAFC